MSDTFDKKELSKMDIRTKYITPAIESAGWDKLSQLREEYAVTKCRINFTHFQNGDIVFAKITPCFQNRKSAIISGLTNECGAGTTDLHVLRTYSGLVLNEYSLWFVKMNVLY